MNIDLPPHATLTSHHMLSVPYAQFKIQAITDTDTQKMCLQKTRIWVFLKKIALKKIASTKSQPAPIHPASQTVSKS